MSASLDWPFLICGCECLCWPVVISLASVSEYCQDPTTVRLQEPSWGRGEDVLSNALQRRYWCRRRVQPPLCQQGDEATTTTTLFRAIRCYVLVQAWIVASEGVRATEPLNERGEGQRKQDESDRREPLICECLRACVGIDGGNCTPRHAEGPFGMSSLAWL